VPEIVVEVYRFDPSRDSEPRFDTHRLEVDERATILDVLREIQRRDPSIAFTYSCRRGVCGTCAVRINGVPLLACQTTVAQVLKFFGSRIRLEPLKSFRHVRDLVVDRSSPLRELLRVRPWLHRSEPYIPPERMEPATAARVHELRRCIYCLACVDACIVRELDPRRFGGPLTLRVLAEMSRHPADSLDRVGMAFSEGLYECLICDLCTAVCPQQIELGSAFIELRAKAWSRGLVHPKVRDAIDGILDPESGNPMWLPREERGEWAKDIGAGCGDTLLFAGCMASYADQESARALAHLMKIAGIEFRVLGSEEPCCGMPMYLAGDLSDAERRAREMLDLFKRLGIRRVVTPCPSCYRMMKSIYPRLGVDMEAHGIEILHATQLLYDLWNRGALQIPRRSPIERATYHDPCDLGRHEGVFEEPRALIEATGTELVEMRRSRIYAACCGAGGNLRIAEPRLSIAIGVERLRRDLPEGIKVVLHACPTCRVQFDDAAREAGIEVRNLSIQELVLETIRGSK